MIFPLKKIGKAVYAGAAIPRYGALPFFLASRLALPVLLLFLAVHGAAAGDNSPLPLIPRLDSRDSIFKQYQSDVEASRRRLFSSGRYPAAGSEDRLKELASSMTIFSYIPGEGEELIGIAARCSMPYATLASLNRLSHAEDMAPGRLLLLPSIPGLFIPEKPANDLEKLLISGRRESGIILSVPREGATEKFFFIPGEDFTPTERLFFLNRGFNFPLKNFEVSSFYGPRKNPVTGKPGSHQGIDLAAPEGEGVYCVRNGTVLALGEDPVLGKYVIVGHDNDWVSFYGHLSAISTVLHAELQSASLIGRVGTTGQSTGPHLHFELRQNGRSRDPARLLGLFKGN